MTPEERARVLMSRLAPYCAEDGKIMDTWLEVPARLFHTALAAEMRVAIAEEREACAKLAEDMTKNESVHRGYYLGPEVAAAIRARP